MMTLRKQLYSPASLDSPVTPVAPSASALPGLAKGSHIPALGAAAVTAAKAAASEVAVAESLPMPMACIASTA